MGVGKREGAQIQRGIKACKKIYSLWKLDFISDFGIFVIVKFLQ